MGVSGVDRAVYLLFNESRLTRDLMFKKMERYDQGCGRNGGRNGPDTFLVSAYFLVQREFQPFILP